MGALFENGRAIDGILILMVTEIAAVLCWRALRGNGPAIIPFLGNLAAGAFLLLAVRGALVGAGPWTLAILLLAALLAHLADLALRWRTPVSSSSQAATALPQGRTDEAAHG